MHNLIAKQLSFWGKTLFWGSIWGCLKPPQDPQYFPGMAQICPKIYPQFSSTRQRGNLTCMSHQRAKKSSFCLRVHSGVMETPRTPNTWPGWPLRAPNLPYDSLLSYGEKNWLACSIKESNDHVLAKNDFESNLGVFSAPPGPPILEQDGPCGL